jgi:hypothetical protein
MVSKKPAEQIIRDDVKRKRLKRVGVGLFLLSVLLLFGITQLYPHGGAPEGAFALGLGGVLAGFVMAAASLKCPICDLAIYKSGACECQPSRAARSAYIDNLKWKAAGPKSGSGT